MVFQEQPLVGLREKVVILNYSHKEPTLQALEDFQTAILENKQPLSDIKGGASVAFAVDMGIRAMDSEQVIDWDPKYNL